MKANEKLSPEDKLLKTIWGEKWKSEAEIEAEIEAQVNSVSDEDFKRVWGKSPDAMLDDIMSEINQKEKKTFKAIK